MNVGVYFNKFGFNSKLSCQVIIEFKFKFNWFEIKIFNDQYKYLKQ